jgi:hypothetical protein
MEKTNESSGALAVGARRRSLGTREGVREGVKERSREGGREGDREGAKEGVKEGVREGVARPRLPPRVRRDVAVVGNGRSLLGSGLGRTIDT